MTIQKIWPIHSFESSNHFAFRISHIAYCICVSVIIDRSMSKHFRRSFTLPIGQKIPPLRSCLYCCTRRQRTTSSSNDHLHTAQSTLNTPSLSSLFPQSHPLTHYYRRASTAAEPHSTFRFSFPCILVYLIASTYTFLRDCSCLDVSEKRHEMRYLDYAYEI